MESKHPAQYLDIGLLFEILYVRFHMPSFGY